MPNQWNHSIKKPKPEKKKKTANTTRRKPKPEPRKRRKKKRQGSQKKPPTIQEQIEKFRRMPLMADGMARVFFQDQKEAFQKVLQILLKDKQIELVKFETQKDMKNMPVGRSLELDLWAEGKDGTRYNLEVDSQPYRVSLKRIFAHDSVVTGNTLTSSEDFSMLPPVCIIVIVNGDVCGNGLLLNTFVVKNEHTQKTVPGKKYYIFNARHPGNDEIGKLLADFNAVNAGDMHHSFLAERMHYLKETRKGSERVAAFMTDLLEYQEKMHRQEMNRALYEAKKKARQKAKEAKEKARQEVAQARREAKEEAKRKAEQEAEQKAKEEARSRALEMLENPNLSLEQISTYSGLSLKEVKDLKNKYNH